MPMGISNAPPSFQRLMELVLHGLHWSICLIYLDDIMVYSADFAQHLKHLRKFFGLKLNPSKSVHSQQVDVTAYASHMLSASERKWSIFDRELFTIVWSVRHFCHYLACHPFTIITDHKTLVGLKKLPLHHDPTSRRARWAVELDLYDWCVHHRDCATG